MKKNLALLIAVAVLGAGIFFWPVGQPGTDTGIISPEAASSRANALTNTPASAVLDSNLEKSSNPALEKVLPAAAAAAPVSAGPVTASATTNLAPLAVLEYARTAVHNYGQRLGGNPVGSNAEITRALLGENPKQVNFISADAGLRVNGGGEWLDAWGTPLFFHQVSGREMEIRSAGPDRLMWTLDDLVTR
jgi:hypothetical protein